MKIKSSRLYSYPVLSSMYDDYVNNKFEIKMKGGCFNGAGNHDK